MLSYLANVFREGTKESFGRVVSLPFLFSSWALLTGGGVLEIIEHKAAPLDTGATLALIGVGLYTGSKALSLKGRQASGSVGPSDDRKSSTTADDAA